MIQDYIILLWYSKEDKSYVAQIPELYECTAFGATPEEAAREIHIAGQLMIDTIKANGDPLPAPRQMESA